jgi:hypothetical protein
MKTKTQLAAKIAKLQSKHDAMPDDVIPTGVIYDEPSAGSEMWCLLSDMSVVEYSYSGISKSSLNSGILFHDEDSAVHAGNVRNIRHRLSAFCAKAWQEFGQVMDWNNREQGKNLIYWEHYTNKVSLCATFSTNYGSFHLPSGYLAKLKTAFTSEELKLAIAGE